MRPYSLDLRERVARACDAGHLTRTEVAEVFDVSTAWVRRLLQRRRGTGSLAAKPQGGGRPPKLDERRRQQLARLVADDADATLAQLRQRLGAAVSLSTVQRALSRLGLAVKKKSCTPPSATAPTSAGSARRGGGGPPASTRPVSCSSTRSGPTSA
jgi:transposase